MSEHTGVYISVPFCKAKCTYCNFASGVFGPERMEGYVERVCAEIVNSRSAASALGAELPHTVDTIYLGGGTPSLLSAGQMQRLFAALRSEFDVAPDAEITLECAPGQLSPATLDEMLRLGINRISFGVQSFVDAEAKAVGRLHTRELCLAEIERMRSAGIQNINLDLIAGLPGQTAASWRESVDLAISTGVPHISVYMLEVDEDSRLGREMLAEGSRYSAGSVPSEDESADWYAAACEWLEASGIFQYEISNFAREGYPSRHNMKYWLRQPYVGFGLDAHSMLRAASAGHGVACDAIRWANTSDLDEYLTAVNRELRSSGAASPLVIIPAESQSLRPGMISPEQAFEESLFLGLRMNQGVNLQRLRAQFGAALVDSIGESLEEAQQAGMLQLNGEILTLTARGRMASNEVFSRLLVSAVR